MNRETALRDIAPLMMPDDERLPHIAESPIWENLITPALVALGYALPGLVAQGFDALAITTRPMFESIYVLGYREGAKQKRAPLTFVCPEEPTDE